MPSYLQKLIPEDVRFLVDFSELKDITEEMIGELSK